MMIVDLKARKLDLHIGDDILVRLSALRRPMASVLHAGCRAIQICLYDCGPLPWEVRQEIARVRDMLPCVSSGMPRQAAPVVLAQDASGPELAAVRRGLKHGACCSVACLPPVDESKAVLREVEWRWPVWPAAHAEARACCGGLA